MIVEKIFNKWILVFLFLIPVLGFIFEEPYLGSMFKKVSYDQIYDEHIYMFSASSVSKIFELYPDKEITITEFINNILEMDININKKR